MKVLVIDNKIDRDSWGSSDLCKAVRLTPQATIYVRRAPHHDLPSSPQFFDRVILSGSKTSALEESPWVDELLHFVQKTIEHRVPLLGVCYGHQVLARALGGLKAVRVAQFPEIGWIEIQQTAPSALMQGLPPSFYSFAQHYDEVSHLPPGTKSLARSERCPIQAFQLEQYPVYGIQFHPEKSISDAQMTFDHARKRKPAPSLLNAHRSQTLYNPKWGEILFHNFLMSTHDHT